MGGARTFHTSVLTSFHLRASDLTPRRGPAPILQACARERMITSKLLLECAGAVSHETSLPECAAHKCTETTDVDARARDFYSHYPFERAGTASRPNFFIWAAQNFGALRCHAVAIGLAKAPGGAFRGTQARGSAIRAPCGSLRARNCNLSAFGAPSLSYCNSRATKGAR